MKTSPRGRAFIQAFEALALRAYPDPGTGGKPWTIGYGSTRARDRGGRVIGPVRPGMVITRAQAEAWFLLDLAEFELGVERLIEPAIALEIVTQGMFDALVSFAYNCGLDEDDDELAEGLGDSTLLRKLNAGDVAGAAEEFGKWIRAGGRVMNGLVRRRRGERDMFLEEIEKK